MEVYNAGNIHWVDSEVTEVCAEPEYDPATDTTPVTNPDYWDCECDNKYIQHKSVEKCRLCGAVRDEMPDSRQYEIDQGINLVSP